MSSTDPDDPNIAVLEARIDAMHAHIQALGARVDMLERREGAHAMPPQYGMPAQYGVPAQYAAPAPLSYDPPPQYAPPQFSAPAVAYNPIDIQPERNPVRVLAAAGGAALLLGLVGFVAYAIEQDWLPPGLRFGAAALFSALLTVAAWPIAKRGHEPIAGAIGGAGLGAWFASWLVARHAYELVSGPQVLVALGLGAAACLLIADRLQLRLMAVLATVAACATPLLVVVGSGRLIELMIYEFAVLGVLMFIDSRRRWPELPTLALMATWMLGAHWAARQPGSEDAGVFMLCASLVLLASAASAWRLLHVDVDAAERKHARARLLIGGLATWAAAAWAFQQVPSSLAMVTLVLAAWHLALAVILDARAPVDERGERTTEAAEPFVGLAWLQAMVAGPVVLEGAVLAGCWVGLSVLAAALPWAALRRIRTVLVLVPAVAAASWSAGHESSSWALLLGLMAAAVPLIASLIGPRQTVPERRPDLPLSLAAIGMWTGVVAWLGPQAIAMKLAIALVPIAILIVRVLSSPRRHGVHVALALLAIALAEGLGAIAWSEALDLSVHVQPATALGLAVLVFALAGLGLALGWRIVAAQRVEQLELDIDVGSLGLLIAFELGLSAVLVVAALVSIGGASTSLGQVGYTTCAALTGLGLLIAGLRADQTIRGSWRQVGLAAIAAAGIKVVLFDLAASAMIWRALSFVGIGAVLIMGAFAYSKAQQRVARDTSPVAPQSG